MERCTKCERKLPRTGMPFKVKLVGSEGHWRWIGRHIVQFFVSFGMLRKYDPENYIALCHECGEKLIALISCWLEKSEKEVKCLLGYKTR